MSEAVEAYIANDTPANLRIVTGDYNLARSRHPRWRALRRFITVPRNLMGLLILLLMFAVAILAPYIATHSPKAQELVARLQPPLWAGADLTHLLGTDQLGRDLFSRIVFGSRVSLLVGFASVVTSAALGIGLGLIAGYFGGRIDTIVMRIVDIWMAFPFILLALAIIAALGPSLRNMVIVFTIAGWMSYARVTRASALSLREMEFVTAARAVGASDRRIIVRHILPNLVSPIIVLASFQVASMIMAEAALSFLGLGVRPPTPAWGSMISEGRQYIQEAWWLSVLPGIALAITVLSVNLVGDGLRDALDAQIEQHIL